MIAYGKHVVKKFLIRRRLFKKNEKVYTQI